MSAGMSSRVRRFERPTLRERVGRVKMSIGGATLLFRRGREITCRARERGSLLNPSESEA